MKIKSLLLGSVAAAGMSTGAYAADLGTVLTSLDVCDQLNITGLTISSDTNCLQISGGVEYEFQWGDYANPVFNYVGHDAGTITKEGGDGLLDWESHVDAWLRFVGTAPSSFGPAQAVIEFGYEEDYVVEDEVHTTSSLVSSLTIEEAYVSVGDTTVLMAGKKGSIANLDDDEPFNYLGLFGTEEVDTGVGDIDGPGTDLQDRTGGHVIQVTSDLGNGVSVGLGLENLDGAGVTSTTFDDGTLVGVIAYAGDGISAHATLLAGGVLDGTIEDWAVHSGFTGEFDMFQVRAAGYFDSDSQWHVMGSAAATFDMFTIAGSVEAADANDLGVGGSISANVTDGVTLNLGARWWDRNTAIANNEVAEVNGQIVAALTESLTATGEVGWIGHNVGAGQDTIYFEGELAWAPGGGFESAVAVGANSDDAYWVNFTASKDFE